MSEPDWEARAERLRRLRRSTTCPVKDCGAGIARTMLLCAHHWREVPGPLKREVRVSSRRFAQDLTAEDAYQDWLDDALAAIEAVENAEEGEQHG